MNQEELQIWLTAYSTAFVSQFKSSVEFWQHCPRGKEYPFDTAAKNISAEDSFAIADLAVQNFRYWKENEEKDWPNHEMFEYEDEK